LNRSNFLSRYLRINRYVHAVSDRMFLRTRVVDEDQMIDKETRVQLIISLNLYSSGKEFSF